MEYTDKRSKMMAEMPVNKVLNKLAAPAIVGMLVSAIYNLVDSIFVGMLGKEAFAAVTVAFPVFMIISAIGQTFGIGGSSYISRLIGKKDKENANKTLATAYFTTLIVAVFISIFGIIYLKPILKLFGGGGTNLAYAIDYTRVLILGSLFTMSNMTLNNALRAEGSAKMSMIALSVGAIMNIVLDPIFIFVINMGVSGAAVATVLSQVISTVVLLSYYIAKKSMLTLSIKNFKPTVKIYSQILIIGIPALIRQSLASIVMGVMNNSANIYGDAALAAIGIMNRVFMFGLYILFGYTQGFLPLAGFSYGAKKFDRLKESIKVTIKNTSIYCIIITIIFLVFTEPLTKLFINDTSVIPIAVKGIRFWSIFLPFLGFSVTINMLFQALGYAASAAFLSLARQGIFLLPSILILPHIFGLNGILMSQTVADFFTIIVTVIMAIRVFKKINKMNEQQALIDKK